MRIFACLFVVLSHASSELATSVELTTFRGAFPHILNSIGHTGTILFFFISGSLLLSEDYQFSPRKFYLNNFLKLLIAYCSWVVIYHLIGFIQRGVYESAHFKDVILNIIRGQVYYHFWYLPMLLGIYLILPFLRAICKAGKNLVLYFVLFFLVVQIGFQTILFLDFPYKELVESLMTRFPLTLVNHHVGYFIMGYFLTYLLKESKIKNPKLWGAVLAIAGPILGLLGDLLLTIQKGGHAVTFNTLFSATLCMGAVGFFLLFYQWQPALSDKMHRGITELAKLTFGIYMLHPLFLEWLSAGLPGLAEELGVFSSPLMTLLSFVAALIPTWILARIPIIRKWILFA